MQVKLSQITSSFEKKKQYGLKNQSSGGSAQKLERIKYQGNQDKSFNVKPIQNYKFQGQDYKRKRSLSNNISREETQKVKNIVAQYQNVLDQLLPILKSSKKPTYHK